VRRKFPNSGVGAFFVAPTCSPSRSFLAAVSRAYARSDMLERRRPLMESWSRYVTGTDAQNIVPIKRSVRAPYRRA
jgi:hypothetical protein